MINHLSKFYLEEIHIFLLLLTSTMHNPFLFICKYFKHVTSQHGNKSFVPRSNRLPGVICTNCCCQGYLPLSRAMLPNRLTKQVLHKGVKVQTYQILPEKTEEHMKL